MGITTPPEQKPLPHSTEKTYSVNPLWKRIVSGLSFFFILIYFDELLAKTGTWA
jgi:hypothetical protein